MDTGFAAEIASCYEVLARGAWDEARAGFERALVDARTPEASKGWAWRPGGRMTWSRLRCSATGLPGLWDRGRSSGVGAGRDGAGLGPLLAGDQAVCRDWRQRAGRLVEALDQCSEHGGPAILDAHLALTVDHDAPAAERASRDAVSLGRELAEIDLEMLGSAY